MSKSTPVTAFREDLLSQCLALSKKTTYTVSAHHQIALIKILQSKKIVQNIDISSYRVKKNLFELISTTHEIKTTVKLCNRCSKNIIRILIQLYFSKQSQSIVFQVSVYCGQHMFVKKFVSMILVSSAHLISQILSYILSSLTISWEKRQRWDVPLDLETKDSNY